MSLSELSGVIMVLKLTCVALAVWVAMLWSRWMCRQFWKAYFKEKKEYEEWRAHIDFKL